MGATREGPGSARDGPRLSRWEVLGAWLRIWTPPRDVPVPPVPWRKVAIVAAATLVVVGVAAVIAVPRIGESRRETAESERRAERALAERRRRRATAEQQARRGRAPAGSRAATLGAVEEAIGRDARRRFDARARPATCSPAAGGTATAAAARFECLSATSDVRGAGGQEGAHGMIGIPYVAVVDFATRRYAFCKINPVPGEQVIPDPRKVVGLPAACRAPR